MGGWRESGSVFCLTHNLVFSSHCWYAHSVFLPVLLFWFYFLGKKHQQPTSLHRFCNLTAAFSISAHVAVPNRQITPCFLCRTSLHTKQRKVQKNHRSSSKTIQRWESGAGRQKGREGGRQRGREGGRACKIPLCLHFSLKLLKLLNMSSFLKKYLKDKNPLSNIHLAYAKVLINKK